MDRAPTLGLDWELLMPPPVPPEGPVPLGLKTLPPPPDDDDEEATICCCDGGGVAKLLDGVPGFMATLHHDGAGFRISAVPEVLPSSLE